MEGWVKKKNYAPLEKLVSDYGASNVSEIEPGEGEEIPVEIEKTNQQIPILDLDYSYRNCTRISGTVVLGLWQT